jgi:DNA invertase Pin-like site-specific DNA recombinase
VRTSRSTETTKIIATYSRVSSGDQVDGTSLDEQARRCASLAQSRDGVTPVQYREEGVSGTTADRPVWQRLLRDCREGRVAKVYALNWKRLARNARIGLQIAEELEELGVGLVVVEADFDTTTPTGKMMRHMMVGFAAFDRDSIVEQMARGQHAMAAKGLWPSGGASPYGYRATGGRTNRLVIEESEANILRQIVAWIVDDGLTTGEVARRLNTTGLFTRHGKEWSHSNLRRNLRQRVLVGEIIWGNTEKTHRSYVPSGKYGDPVTLKFDPIISEERYAALQVALDVRATGPRAGAKTYPLSGRMVSPCGEGYGGVHRRDRGLRQYRCRCRQWTATGSARCRDPLLMADVVEDRVWSEVTALLTSKTRLLNLARDYLGLRVEQVQVEQDELNALKRRASTLERTQRETLVNLVRRGFDAEAIAEATEKVALDLSVVRQRIAEVEAWAADSATESTRVMSVWQLAEMAGQRLQRMSLDERKRVFALLDIKVTVLDTSREPALRVEGTLCHEKLIDGLARPGDVTVAGTPPDAPRRR